MVGTPISPETSLNTARNIPHIARNISPFHPKHFPISPETFHTNSKQQIEAGGGALEHRAKSHKIIFLELNGKDFLFQYDIFCQAKAKIRQNQAIWPC